jgi:hypothetical protein
MKKVVFVVAVVLALAFASSPVAAQGKSDRFYASSERFGYSGTVSVYDTWADANSGRNARCSAVAWDQRDGAIFVVKNVPEYYIDANMLLTFWWSGNPSNQNTGFIQLYDENADAWQNQKGSWSKDRNSFTVTARGRNATYGSPDPQDYARLWNACSPAGSGEATAGTYLKYEYVFTATGLNGVAGPDGFITNTTDAADYSGHFRGIFHNESLQYPASNGYYVFDIRFNNESWAVLNNVAYPDQFGGKK